MKHSFIRICAATLALAMLAALPAYAASQSYYPTDVTQSEDGKEIRKTYELSADQDPAGIPTEDFAQGDFHYTLKDLLREEIPEHQERSHTETVTQSSQTNDKTAVLASLPQTKTYASEDGYTGTLTLQPDSVRIEAAGYTNSTKTVTATRSYPNLSSQDTSYIPKTIEDNGKTLTLQSITWQTDNTVTVGGVQIGNRFTAVATYAGTVTSSSVTGYTVTAEYTGTVSRDGVSKIRYTAVFEGVALAPVATPTPTPEATESPDVSDPPVESEALVIPVEPDDPPVPSLDIVERDDPAPSFEFNWAWLLIPLGVVATAGMGVSLALMIKRRKELDGDEDKDDDEDEYEEDDEV